jgi:hypothetical protein
VPNWQPNWTDVVFDHGKAQSAVDACNQAAGALDTVLAGFDGANVTLTTNGEWQGRYRADYDREAPAIATDGQDTRRALRQLAQAITDAMGEARREQAHRVSERERWRTERDRELANRPRGGRQPVPE